MQTPRSVHSRILSSWGRWGASLSIETIGATIPSAMRSSFSSVCQRHDSLVGRSCSCQSSCQGGNSCSVDNYPSGQVTAAPSDGKRPSTIAAVLSLPPGDQRTTKSGPVINRSSIWHGSRFQCALVPGRLLASCDGWCICGRS